MKKTGLEYCRPIIDVPRSNFELVFEVLAVLGILVMVIVFFGSYFDLPERVPTHYTADGTPNCYGGKISLLVLSIINIVMFSLLSLTRKIPHYFNFPYKITLENAERMYRVGIELMACVKTAVVWLFTYIVWQTIRVAEGEAQGLDPVFMKLFLYAMVAVLIIHIVRMRRAK